MSEWMKEKKRYNIWTRPRETVEKNTQSSPLNAPTQSLRIASIDVAMNGTKWIDIFVGAPDTGKKMFEFVDFPINGNSMGPSRVANDRRCN